MKVDRQNIQRCILEMTQARGLEKTICPSEVARKLGGADWRGLMDEVRSLGTELAEQGIIQVTQRGEPVDPTRVKGPIRFRITEKGLE